MRIIPAIDIIEGKCVRLTKGDYSQQKTYNENPLEVAKTFEDAGINYLHLVDLDGAKAGKIINHKVLELIATQTSLQIDFGGGIKTNEDLQIAFNSGAAQITGGSIAVKNPDLFLSWLLQYGSDKIILGADAVNKKIVTNAWQSASEEEVVSFIKKYNEKGIEYVICTDVSKDGMLQGASHELYQEILSHAEVKLIASGGVSSLNDLSVLKTVGCYGAIIGKAIYEKRFSIKELQEWIIANK